MKFNYNIQGVGEQNRIFTKDVKNQNKRSQSLLEMPHYRLLTQSTEDRYLQY